MIHHHSSRFITIFPVQNLIQRTCLRSKIIMQLETKIKNFQLVGFAEEYSKTYPFFVFF